ncbi:molybdopterin-binding protein [Spirosoma rhododendri]|uniref:hypothetical protein n=1 Tax=Spirosoma rhododendri TaxID=2728024 RepID=UPI0020C578E0|nr:hypothetical protein [Spirosoma rhododendri]
MNGSRAKIQLLFTVVALLLTTISFAQTITISGELTKPLTLKPADIKAMSHTAVTTTDRDGKEHTYSGIPLIALLNQAGPVRGLR